MTYKLAILAAVTSLFLTHWADAEASVHQVCVRYQIQTSDSALASASPREDHFLNANNTITVPAYGAYINVYRNGSSVTGGAVPTDPSTGCKTFWSFSDGSFTMRVYARSEDSKGNNVRIHDGGPGTFAKYPGKTFSILTAFSSPTSSTQYVTVGSASPRWTMMAAASFILKRFNDGLSGKMIHIAEDTTSGCSNSSWFGASNDSLDEGRAYLRIASNSGACSAESRDGKFMIGHEMGHALLRLRAGTKEGPWSASFPYGQMQGSVAGCVNDPNYSPGSVEWSGVAFKEGSADFVSARAWNDRASGGRYGILNSNIDLEFASVHKPGGRLVNVCNVASASGWGLGILSDWLRFWWDWYTDNTCSPTASKLKMMDVFSKTINDHQDGNRIYLDNTAFGAVLDAVDSKGYGSCLENRFRLYACWNGIDREAGYTNDGCY